MFHTHAPLPRGFFMEVTNGEELLSVSWSRKLQWLQNTGKWVDELARRLSLRSWCQFSMSDRASICILRACCDKVCVVVAKWLARWAKSSAVKIWHGSVAKSVWSVSIFSRIADWLLCHCWECCTGYLPVGGSDLEPVMRQRWPRWTCCHPSRIHGESLGTPTSDQHCQTVATAGANVGSCLQVRECRRNDASNWQGEWLVASCLCSPHFPLWHDQRFHWRSTPVACSVLLLDDPLLSLPGDLGYSIQEAILSSWRCEYVGLCSVSGFPIATDRLPLGGTTEIQMA